MQRTPSKQKIESEIYGTSDMARICHVSPPTAAKWIDQGKIPSHTTLGGHRRVTYADLLGFLEKYKFPVPKEWQ